VSPPEPTERASTVASLLVPVEGGGGRGGGEAKGGGRWKGLTPSFEGRQTLWFEGFLPPLANPPARALRHTERDIQRERLTRTQREGGREGGREGEREHTRTRIRTRTRANTHTRERVSYLRHPNPPPPPAGRRYLCVSDREVGQRVSRFLFFSQGGTRDYVGSKRSIVYMAYSIVCVSGERSVSLCPCVCLRVMGVRVECLIFKVTEPSPLQDSLSVRQKVTVLAPKNVQYIYIL